MTEDDMKFMVGDFVYHNFFIAKICYSGVFTRQLQFPMAILAIANANLGLPTVNHYKNMTIKS